jgi:sulfite dehydrogenase (quinone) subunit SoeA
VAISRRTFLKGTAAATGTGVVAARYLSLETLVFASPEETPQLTDEWVATTCWIGKQDCGMLARRVNGRVVKLEGNPDHPRNFGKLCPKGVAQITSLYDPNRLRTPLVRTNDKGVPGTWREASWDEALEIVATRMNDALARDPRLVGYVPGREKVAAIYNTAFTKAAGITYAYGRRGNCCGGAHQDAVLATWGDRGVVTPDLRHCNYLICYWNLTQAGGPSLCQITYPHEVAEAKARGMKVVSINPYARPVAHAADEWVPVKPGTDMAFWLAVINVLLAEGFVDETFLKRHTNATSLVRGDGMLLQQEEQDLVWDSAAEKAVSFDPGVDAALTGEFTVDGETVKPAFQVLHDHVQQYTPEWASDVCKVPAAQIRKIAMDLGSNAMIGSTIVIDGVEVPYRPVAYGMHGTASKFHSSIQANRAILMAFMILGAVEAAGGPQFWNKRFGDVAAVHERWKKASMKEELDRLDLGGTAWFPLGSSGYHMFPVTMNDPERFKLPYKPEDMAMLLCFANPVMTSRPIDKVIDAWKRFGFVSVITPFMSATADYAADVILPCGTLDKWEGPIGGKTLYESADAIRVPIMEPVGQSKGEIEIFTELSEKMGKLHGDDGFISQINQALSIKEDYLLPLDRKPTPESILDAWAQSKYGVSLEEFQTRGVTSKKVSADKRYLSIGETPYGGVRAAFYVEAFLTIGNEMRARNVPESLWSKYAPYPTWTDPVMDQSPPEYDLFLMDFKRIEHKHARTFGNPLLNELVHENPVVMNTTTASAKGLKDGDTVWVESQNPLTGATRKIKTIVATTEGIRPDTVALTHHVNRPEDPSVNHLFIYEDGFWDMGGSLFSHIKVKVSAGT